MWGNSRQTTIASSKWFTLHTHCRQIQPRREKKNEHRSTLRAHFRRTMGKYLCMCRLGACWEPLNIFGQKAAMMCVCFASSVTCTIFGKNRRSILAATREMTYSHKCTHAHRIRQCLFGNGYGSSSGSSSGNNSSTTTSTSRECDSTVQLTMPTNTMPTTITLNRITLFHWENKNRYPLCILYSIRNVIRLIHFEIWMFARSLVCSVCVTFPIFMPHDCQTNTHSSRNSK